MLEYTKMILKKVSFDISLFTRELQKAFHWLRPDELILLRNWCLVNFGGSYKEAVIKVYNKNDF